MKELRKEHIKEFKEIKELRKETYMEKNQLHDKAIAHDKQIFEKPLSEGKFQDKLQDKLSEGGGHGGFGGFGSSGTGSIDDRVAFLESQMGMIQPFIGQSLRPDLSEGALQGENNDE